jgi:hypothetical protein
MPKPQIQPIYTAFDAQIRAALRLVDDTSGMGYIVKGKFEEISNNFRAEIAELALLRLHLAWEQFLEATFLRHMCGALSISGQSPRRLVQASSISVATKVLSGAKSYSTWSDPKEVCKRAAIHFRDGEPYKSAIGAGEVDLMSMNKIRNRVAHRSEKSLREFLEVVRQEVGSIPRGMTPGKLLLFKKPSGRILIEHYGTVLDVIAKDITK